MADLKGKTLLISGASRGIGLAIGLRAAKDGANVAILAKTAEPHPKLPGTIYTAGKDIEQAGGKSLPIVTDIRHEEQVAEAIEKTVQEFGGIDICINNASAIQLTDTASTEMKRFDLMQAVNTRGTYMLTKYCLPHLEKSENAHIMMLSPPLDMNPKWFAGHVAYSIAKYGMSLCVLGMAAEFAGKKVAVNALWPRTTIATAAVQNVLGEYLIRKSRTADILADAAYIILTKPAAEFTGNFCIDDTLLAEHGVTDFDQYRVDASADLQLDYFVPEDYLAPASLEAAE